MKNQQETISKIADTLDMVRSFLPLRPQEGHKGTFGHVFVLAGSRGFTGAARLTCEGAGRSGVGLVTVGAPSTLMPILASSLVESMWLPLPATDTDSLAYEALEPALAFAANKQSVVLGPGLSKHPETQRFVLDFVKQCPVPLLIDADGLNALSGRAEALLHPSFPRIVTPHPGEMARLTGLSVSQIQNNRLGMAGHFAKAHNCVVVLKGHHSVVAAPDDTQYVNPTGNSGMATGGTGDILAGLIGGLLAQGMTPKHAALLGVYLHGLAGDIASQAKTQRAMLARDVIAALPDAWRVIEAGE